MADESAFCSVCGMPVKAKMFCKHCGEQIDSDCIVCPKCGKQIGEIRTAPVATPAPVVIHNNNINTNTNTNMIPGIRLKNKWVAFLLCFFLGFFGVHKFYEGKIIMGIIYILTVGFMGIGVFIDLIVILCKPRYYY